MVSSSKPPQRGGGSLKNTFRGGVRGGEGISHSHPAPSRSLLTQRAPALDGRESRGSQEGEESWRKSGTPFPRYLKRRAP